MAMRGMAKALGAVALVAAGVGGATLLLGGGCKDSRQAGKETRRTVEKGKELLKEGLGVTKEAAKEGLDKGSEVVKEGLDATKDAAQDFKKGWDEGERK